MFLLHSVHSRAAVFTHTLKSVCIHTQEWHLCFYTLSVHPCTLTSGCTNTYTLRSVCIHTQEWHLCFVYTLCTFRSVCIHTQKCMYTHSGVASMDLNTLCTLRSVCIHTFTLRSGRLIEPSSRVLSLIKGSLTSSDDLLQWLGAFLVPTPVCVVVCVFVCVHVCMCVSLCMCVCVCLPISRLFCCH
jgi:hypothetical protein